LRDGREVSNVAPRKPAVDPKPSSNHADKLGRTGCHPKFPVVGYSPATDVKIRNLFVVGKSSNEQLAFSVKRVADRSSHLKAAGAVPPRCLAAR
jgi:hypothetical protein